MFPSLILFPPVTALDFLHQIATYMLTLLRTENKKHSILTSGDPISNIYIQIAQVLKRATEPPSSTTNKPSTVPAPAHTPAISSRVQISSPTAHTKPTTMPSPTPDTKLTPNPEPTPTPEPEPMVQVFLPSSAPRVKHKILDDPY